MTSRTTGNATNMATKKLDLSLRLRHPIADLTSIAGQLAATPTVNWVRGEPRRSIRGEPLNGVRDSSYCSIPLGITESTELDEVLSRCIERIAPIKRELHQLVQSGGTAAIAIGWFCNGDAGGSISADAVMRLSRLKLSLDFYLYFSSDN